MTEISHLSNTELAELYFQQDDRLCWVCGLTPVERRDHGVDLDREFDCFYDLMEEFRHRRASPFDYSDSRERERLDISP